MNRLRELLSISVYLWHNLAEVMFFTHVSLFVC